MNYFWLLCGTGEWIMYLVTCTHVLLFPVGMNTISDIWGLLFDRHQKVQRTPIESCHDYYMLTLHSIEHFFDVSFFFLFFFGDLSRKDNEQHTGCTTERSRHGILQVQHLNAYAKLKWF